MTALAQPERPAGLSQNEIDAALLSPSIFTHRHCWIRGPGGRTMRFRLYPYQRETIDALDEHDRVFVLKARQLGISWCADAYALWLCTANRGQTVLIFSVGLREAHEEMDRIRFMWHRLPPELKRLRGGGAAEQRDNLSRIEFPEMDSRIISLPSSEHGGSSYTATMVIVQELAKIANATSLMAGVVPTMADAGKLAVVSTAVGFGGVFANIWNGTPKQPGIGERWHSGQIVGDPGGRGDYVPVFIPWHARPGRDLAFYQDLAKVLDDKELKREYPSKPVEAFAGSSVAVFADEFDRNGELVLDASRDPESSFEVVNAIDPGLNHAVAYLIEVFGDSAFVFDEIWEEDLTSPEMALKIQEAHQFHGLRTDQVLSYIDPYAIGRNTESRKTEKDLYSEAGLLVDYEDVQTPPEQRVKLIKLLLRRKRLWISMDCPYLLSALERAQWKTRRVPGSGEVIQEDTYAKDGLHEHCIARGSLIATEHGGVPIEDVRVGDRVWTRAGLRPVIASGLTQRSVEVFELETTSGEHLRATGNHKVWTEDDGFVRLDALRYDAGLCVWPSELPSASARRVAAPVTPSCVPACSSSGVRNISKVDQLVDVFDLTVEGQHEFFADGVLVHNCLDALGTGLARIFPSSAGAAGERSDGVNGGVWGAQWAAGGSEYG